MLRGRQRGDEQSLGGSGVGLPLSASCGRHRVLETSVRVGWLLALRAVCPFARCKSIEGPVVGVRESQTGDGKAIFGGETNGLREVFRVNWSMPLNDQEPWPAVERVR